MTNLQHLLALHHTYPLTLNKLRKILYEARSIDELKWLSASDLAHILNIGMTKALALKSTYSSWEGMDMENYYASLDIEPVPYTSADYPKELLQLPDAPVILYTKGNRSLLTSQKKIACIGSRQATQYSVEAFRQLMPPLIADGYVIVSGLAKGADTLAHRSAIHYGGHTIAVLGHGLQTIYPKSNEELAGYMSQHHLLVSEYPPDMGPRKHHFPMRNRIISGLSAALVVTEAAMRSGTIITTELALEQGKDVFAVPGPITSAQSSGTNNLIKEGAIPVWNGYQIIEELQMFQMKN
jgi:DNA processing protein